MTCRGYRLTHGNAVLAAKMAKRSDENPARSKLFEPYRLGPLESPNRIIMAPLTRNRAGMCLLRRPRNTTLSAHPRG